MSERDIRRRIRGAAAPGEAEAAERARRVMRAAFDEVAPRPRRQPRLRLGLAGAAAVSLATVALTPPGAAVGDWVRDVVSSEPSNAVPTLDSLPAPARLLVMSERGPWVVRQDGSKRRLGTYDDARWSPNGKYVIATRGRELIALEPDDGDVRWTINAEGPVTAPAWKAPDGYRVAYLSGSALHVSTGDGEQDERLITRVAPVRPAWRPGEPNVLAFVRPGGEVEVLDTDRRRRLGRAAPGEPPLALEWTADGRRLVVLGERGLRVLDSAGRSRRSVPFPAGAVGETLAVAPAGAAAAVVRRRGATSEVVAVPLGGGRERSLFSGPGRFGDLAWSPNGKWLLVPWRSADQWLFIAATAGRRTIPVDRVSRVFDPGADRRPPFPRVTGWAP